MHLLTTDSVPIVKVFNGEKLFTEDQLAIEEPLEIRLQYFSGNILQTQSISVTMRTPGKDRELALGFLLTEGIINHPGDLAPGILNGSQSHETNSITICLRENLAVDLKKLQRHFYTSSSCGVCGKSSLEAIHVKLPELSPNQNLPIFSADLLHQLPDKLRERQETFESTGGLHASALFDLSGELLLIQEDVGRHNALDKLIGSALMEGLLPLKEHLLLLSGRASFELIQKAAVAGINIIAAVGAPSSLAVQLAKKCNMTLLGFLRNNRYNIYSGEQRIKLGS